MTKKRIPMDNIIFLPTPELLAQAYSDIHAEKDISKHADYFRTLAGRVKEHSEELKRLCEAMV